MNSWDLLQLNLQLYENITQNAERALAVDKLDVKELSPAGLSRRTEASGCACQTPDLTQADGHFLDQEARASLVRKREKQWRGICGGLRYS